MRVAIYARYSTDRQDARSIDDQLRRCRDHAAARGYDVVAEHHDAAVSGSHLDRAGMRALLESARRPRPPFAAVLVDDLSRLSRDLGDTWRIVFQDLAAAQITVVDVSTGMASDAAGARLTFSALALVNDTFFAVGPLRDPQGFAGPGSRWVLGRRPYLRLRHGRRTESTRPRAAEEGADRQRERVVLPDGARERVFGSAPKHDNTKVACQQALREHMERLRQQPSIRKEVPTFSEWFQGRFWTEWVLGEENKPSVQGEKESAFRVHLRPAFGELGLDEINAARVQQFKAELKAKLGRTGKPLSLKTRNNILAVLSKALRYAEEVRLIQEAPRIRLYKVERPEIVFWDIAEYGRLLVAARDEGAVWHVAVLLAGDAGLRLGEILALGWEDIDLIACKLTVRRQVRRGQEGTPKGRTRRTVPMTERLTRALLSLSKDRRGRVMCHGNGVAVTDGEAKHIIYRMCRSAGLPERAWHVLRHSMATHAARLGVNPWSLQRWLGHKRIDETMRYVHHAEEHPRPVPPDVLQAGASIDEPDSRIIAMLGARGELGAESSPGGLDCSWQ